MNSIDENFNEELWRAMFLNKEGLKIAHIFGRFGLEYTPSSVYKSLEGIDLSHHDISNLDNETEEEIIAVGYIDF